MNAISNKTFAIGAAIMMFATMFATVCAFTESPDSSSYYSPEVGLNATYCFEDTPGTHYLYEGTSVNVQFTDNDDFIFSGLDYRYWNGSSWTSWAYLYNHNQVTANGLTITADGLISGSITGSVIIRANYFYPENGSDESVELQLTCVNLNYVGSLVAGEYFTHSFDGEFTAIEGVTITGGNLPAGITLSYNESAWTISGTPTVAGTYYCTFGTDEFFDEIGENVSGYFPIKLVVSQPTSYAHTITYSANGGSGSTENTVVTDQVNGNTNVTLASCGFTKTNCTFAGWKIGNTVYQPGQSIPVGANATVAAVAQWSQNSITISSVPTQYKNSASEISFSVSSVVSPAGTTVAYSVQNIDPAGITVSVNGNTITVGGGEPLTTYHFTLRATANNCPASSTQVTVVVVPILEFTNNPTAGAINQ